MGDPAELKEVNIVIEETENLIHLVETVKKLKGKLINIYNILNEFTKKARESGDNFMDAHQALMAHQLLIGQGRGELQLLKEIGQRTENLDSEVREMLENLHKVAEKVKKGEAFTPETAEQIHERIIKLHDALKKLKSEGMD
ncbi:hypothetical protein ACFL0W_02905 [Nanoarchaeota archaeon]